MIRFSWLQFRAQALVVAAALVALAIAAAITGIHLSHLYTSDVTHCQTGCDSAISEFLNRDRFMDQLLDVTARVVPALLGIFWGAPLLTREWETGTNQLAWTQSVTRSRWLLTKLAITGLLTTAVAGILTLTITWWERAFDTVNLNQYAVLDRRDIAPIGYAIFAFAAGTFIGALLRRTLPAMAATLGVFVFARVADALWIRPHLLAPRHLTLPLSSLVRGFGQINGGTPTLFTKADSLPNAWITSTRVVDASGHTVTPQALTANCPQLAHILAAPPPTADPGKLTAVPAPGGRDALSSCVTSLSRTYHGVISYQPASRYWPFQWLEAGVFVALACAAFAGCFWLVTRRS